MSANTSIGDALFGQSRQRLLGILFGQPERSFYAKELMRLTGSGNGAVQRELESLSASGLLRVTRVGNQKHYQANPDAPIFAELCAIATKTFGITDVVRAALQPLASRLDLALIYGSVAKSQMHADSDVDLMIVSDTLGLEEIFGAVGSAESRLGRRISPTLYTTEEFRRRLTQNNPFLSKVLSGETIVLSGSLDSISSA